MMINRKKDESSYTKEKCDPFKKASIPLVLTDYASKKTQSLACKKSRVIAKTTITVLMSHRELSGFRENLRVIFERTEPMQYQKQQTKKEQRN